MLKGLQCGLVKGQQNSFFQNLKFLVAYRLPFWGFNTIIYLPSVGNLFKTCNLSVDLKKVLQQINYKFLNDLPNQ